MKKQTALILLAVIALAVVPLFIHWNSGKEGQFGGSDDRAANVIAETHPTYKPWFRPIWTPPSDEVASLLFALQAALGAGVLGYYFGLVRGRAEGKKRAGDIAPH